MSNLKNKIPSGIIVSSYPMQLDEIDSYTTTASLQEVADGSFSLVFESKPEYGGNSSYVVEIASNCDCLDFRYVKTRFNGGTLVFVGQDRTTKEQFVAVRMVNDQLLGLERVREFEKTRLYKFNIESNKKVLFNGDFVVASNEKGNCFNVCNLINNEIYSSENNELLKILGFKFIGIDYESGTIKCEFTINGETVVDNIEIEHFNREYFIEKFFVGFVKGEILLGGRTLKQFMGDKYKSPMHVQTDKMGSQFFDTNLATVFINESYGVDVRLIDNYTIFSALGFKFKGTSGKDVQCEFTINGETFAENLSSEYFYYEGSRLLLDFLQNKIRLNEKTYKDFFGEDAKIAFQEILKYSNRGRKFYLGTNLGLGLIDETGQLVSQEEALQLINDGYITNYNEFFFGDRNFSVEEKKHYIVELMGYIKSVKNPEKDDERIKDYVCYSVGNDIVYIDSYNNVIATDRGWYIEFGDTAKEKVNLVTAIQNNNLSKDDLALLGDILVNLYGKSRGGK